MKPGIYKNLPRQKYEAIEAVNYSTLKHFDQSAAHAREYILHPPPPTRAMDLGSAVHMAVLEPDDFEKEYVLAPKIDRRTKEGKAKWAAFEAENNKKTYLSESDWDLCEGIMKQIKNNAEISQILYGKGNNELTVVWNDEETGLLCKARIDRVTTYNNWTVLVDIKTTTSAAENLFASQAARMNYHLQAAFYLDGLNTAMRSENDRRYLIIPIEKSRPYAMRIFEFDLLAMEEGRVKYQAFLRQYKECVETNYWPGYSQEIKELSLPAWATGNIYSEIELEEIE